MENKSLPEGWKVVRLAHVCEKAQTVKRNEKSPIDELLYLDISSIDNKRNRVVAHKTYQWKDAPSRAQQIVKVGDVLFSTVRTYLRNIAPVTDAQFNNQIASTGFTVIRGNKAQVDSRFLLYYVLSETFLRPLNELQTGTSYPAVRDKDVFAQNLPLPPLPEQQRIVAKMEELFSELDAGKQELEKAAQQLKVYRQAVLKWAFESEKERYKTRLLSEVTEKIQIGPFGTQLHREDYVEGGIPLINPMHIVDGKVKADSSYTISPEKRDSLSNYILKQGDVIMGRRGEMGRCGLITDKEEGWFCGTGSLYFRPMHSIVDSSYLFLYLGSDTSRRYLEANAGGTTMANLNLKIVNSIPLPLPPLEEQQCLVQEIEVRLSVCDKMEETIAESLHQAEALRQSILKKAFEGELIR